MDVDLANAGTASLAEGSLSFGLLQIVSEARNEHGLRHHDYKLYREYCSKKVHRLRRVERITHADDKHVAVKQTKPGNPGRKGKSGTSGKGRKVRQTPTSQSAAAKTQGPNVFTPKVIKAENISNERPVLLLLFEAERAWAHSQEYRNASFENEEDNKLRKLGLSRLKRAVQWADELISLLRALPENAVDAQLIAEAVAYRTTLEGIRLFDRGTDATHESALAQFCVARVLLNDIATYSPTSRREALAYTFVDQGEAPLRFCAYQLGLTSDLSNLDILARERASPEVCEQVYTGYASVVSRLREVSEARIASGEEQKRSVKVEWHGRQFSIRNPDLLEAIAKVQTEQEHLTQVLHSAATANVDSEDGATRREKRTFVRLTHAQRRAKKRSAGSAGSAVKAGSGSRVSSTGESDPYDRALAALGEAEEISQQLIAENEEALAKSHTARFEAASADLRLVHDYIQYQLMSLRIARAEHMMKSIKTRTDRHEAQAQAVLESKLARLAGKSSPSSSRATDGANSVKKDRPKRVLATKKVGKKRLNVRRQKQRSKSKPKAQKAKVASPAQGSKHHRRPARSGTRAQRVKQRAAEARQLRSDSLEEARRRIIQSVPSLARLFDGAEVSVSTIATLGLVESDPETSSLVDAKAAWYRAEMLRTIARAYALSGSYAQALLLLARASLFVRQARQSFGLVVLDGADAGEDSTALQANKDFPPLISAEVLDLQDEEIKSATHATQREMFFGKHKVVIAGSAGAYAASKRKVAGGGGGGVATDASRLGTALRDLATKYVDFEDTIDLQQASSLPEDVQAQLEEELETIEQQARGATSSSQEPKKKGKEQDVPVVAPKSSAAPQQPTAKPTADVQSVKGDDVDETTGGPYDPANDDEGGEGEGAQQARGWFGGWFGRK
ncbi:unnamed protein product [Tilletia controversa]|uniref:Signal recognition particle subunit SRP68 n=3 Tax=Tilletia TaxID=13289 RepID=A0A8X7MVB6_9BASI|nr:hypothetical protein CF336_g1767 [Tilletia laevis]KAE8204250.1 hypothetical protein CF328_g1193 [Tilletia controversa]KAE8264008.1 hypothetical protein A4X03_0g1262 [Tilletia caries]KAE8207446.1 hypothetical protein CF335_g1127 [Tilletia laevis]KAE8248612.1 hypothetical protein A4X06_0g3601 [Tilletia controversa]